VTSEEITHQGRTKLALRIHFSVLEACHSHCYCLQLVLVACQFEGGNGHLHTQRTHYYSEESQSKSRLDTGSREHRSGLGVLNQETPGDAQLQTVSQRGHSLSSHTLCPDRLQGDTYAVAQSSSFRRHSTETAPKFNLDPFNGHAIP
jgi:hypothetical protein